MESPMLFLINRYGEWTYARLAAIEVTDDYIDLAFFPRPNDNALKNILAEYRGFVGLACEAHTCHASIREVSTQYADGEDVVKMRCRRIVLQSTLDRIAEEKVEQAESEWDKPSRSMGTYDGMMGFVGTVPVRPGFVTMVNQVAWKILLGRGMPLEYGEKARHSGLGDANSSDPNIRQLQDVPCPLRLLHPVYHHNMKEYVALAKLFAGYVLMEHGVVDFINEFTIKADPSGQITVSFRGSRAGVTKGDLPIQVAVQGTYLPEPPIPS